MDKQLESYEIGNRDGVSRKARCDKIHAPASTQPVHEQVHKFDIAFCPVTITGMGLMSSDNKDSERGRNMINR